MEPFATCVRGFYPVADPCSALLNPLKDLGRLAFRSGFGSLYSNFKRNNMVQAATWHLLLSIGKIYGTFMSLSSLIRVACGTHGRRPSDLAPVDANCEGPTTLVNGLQRHSVA